MVDLLQGTKFQVSKDIGNQKSLGKFALSPLPKGFALTIGNSLRRILLSGIPGAGVVGVSIVSGSETITQEFSTITGVKQDMMSMIANIKKLVLRLNHGEKSELKLTIKNKKADVADITAQDIVCSSDVEILNPNLFICSVNGAVSLEITIFVRKDYGFKTAEVNKMNSEFSIDVIPVDCIFSPITNVALSVQENFQNSEDKESLGIVVHTNGSVEPLVAVQTAGQILESYCSVIQIDKNKAMDLSRTTHDIAIEVDPIETLNIGRRACNTLSKHNISTIGDLIRISSTQFDEMITGVKTRDDIMHAMEKRNLYFRA
jgi:DNA-directed RNA polymerase subunit alpha